MHSLSKHTCQGVVTYLHRVPQKTVTIFSAITLTISVRLQ